jgi:hypothetical protein
MSNEDTKQQPASSEKQPAKETANLAKPGLEPLTAEDLEQMVGDFEPNIPRDKAIGPEY